MRIMRRYELQAAHQLPRVPEGHKCGRMHGHTYQIEVWVEGNHDITLGWFMDFAELDVIWKAAVHDKLDHRVLNDMLENPTTEELCIYIAAAMRVSLRRGVRLVKLVVCENNHSAVEWTPT